jgi:hypothetical protein
MKPGSQFRIFQDDLRLIQKCRISLGQLSLKEGIPQVIDVFLCDLVISPDQFGLDESPEVSASGAIDDPALKAQ